MRFTEEQLNRFIDLYQNEFGETLTKEQAAQEAADLVDMLLVVYQPIKRSVYQRFVPLNEKAL